jgi:hypothetical protein
MEEIPKKHSRFHWNKKLDDEILQCVFDSPNSSMKKLANMFISSNVYLNFSKS